MSINKNYQLLLLAALIAGCAKPSKFETVIPALEYSKRIAGGSMAPQTQSSTSAQALVRNADYANESAKAQLRLVKDEAPSDALGTNEISDVVTNDPSLKAEIQGAEGSPEPGYYEHRNPIENVRQYVGPLSLGDPGISASLWKESRGGNDIFRDSRAFQPMDLITIVVTESAEGSKSADTEIKQKSTLAAAIESLIGAEDTLTNKNPNVDLDSLLKASTTNDYKGEGETTRKDSLKARISAMVAEVLPSGILRIEGEKIISVNNEEQVMIISGLVRTRDVNSSNEIDSSKIANMRIDYYGRGVIGEAQREGWGTRLIRVIWPF